MQIADCYNRDLYPVLQEKRDESSLGASAQKEFSKGVSKAG